MTAAIDESAILAACEKKREYILSNLEYVQRLRGTMVSRVGVL
jgi:hypothetical protein